MARALVKLPDTCVAHRIYGSRRGDDQPQQLRRNLHETRDSVDRRISFANQSGAAAYNCVVYSSDRLHRLQHLAKRSGDQNGYKLEAGILVTAVSLEAPRHFRGILIGGAYLVARHGQPSEWPGTPPSLDSDSAVYLCSQWHFQKAGDQLGCTYECFKALNATCLALLCAVISSIWASLSIPVPSLWRTVHELGATPWEMFALLRTLPDSWILHCQGLESEPQPMTSGVPQGSSTSLALFNAVMWLILRRIQARNVVVRSILDIAAEEFAPLHFILNLDKCQIAVNPFIPKEEDDAIPAFLERFDLLTEITVLGATLDMGASCDSLLLGALARGTRAWWSCHARVPPFALPFKWASALSRSQTAVGAIE
eukprot:5957478-Amphidinium_carterae.1